MSREKEIADLSEEIYRNCHACLLESEAEMIAEFVIEKQGYRKQSEGEWIWKSNGYMKHLHCSCCGKQEEWETAYCPNCGAKMKGVRYE